MKKRIKADSVDELFEIVKAIQNGEEPEAYAKRKAAEAEAAEAAAKKAAREEAKAKKKKASALARPSASREQDKMPAQEKPSAEKSLAEEEDDEAFERLLDDESGKDLQVSTELLAGRLRDVGNFLKTGIQAGVKEGRNRLNHLRADIFEEEEDEFEWEEASAIPTGTEADAPSIQKTTAVHNPGSEIRTAGATDVAPEESRQRVGEMREIRPEDDGERAIQSRKYQPEGGNAGESQSRMETAGSADGAPVSSGAGMETAGAADETSARSGGAMETAGAADGMPARSGAALENRSAISTNTGDSSRSQPKAERSVVHGRLSDTEKMPAGKTRRRYGAKSISEEAEKVGQRILRSLHMETETADSDGNTDAYTDVDIESIDLDTVQILDRLLDGTGSGRAVSSEGAAVASADQPAAPEAERAPVRIGATVEKAGAADGVPASSGTGIEKAGAADGVPASSGTGIEKAGAADGVPVSTGAGIEKAGAADGASAGPGATLENGTSEEKGFGSRQRIIAGIGAVAALLVIVLIVCAVSGTIRRHAKQKYVTADSGLTILVENQPDSWCNSCELELKIKVKSGTISSVEVGGTVYETDEKGRVTVTVEESLVDVAVVTEESTLTAQIEIPMLDAVAPVLSVDKSQGEITVTAADARSDLAGIWYAVLDEDDWLQLPLYQEYSEPIPYEENKIYYFYAADQAGNISTPLVTNMVEAESVSLSETELTLLEGETAYLQLSVTPSNAYLTNVTYESSNTDVVTVSSSGLVTAVAEGGALIRVSADDVETVSCSVTVVTEQTVTVSAVGDCTLGTYAGLTYTTNFNTYYSMYGSSYFFENVRDILENDDITFANLEGPLTDETTAVEKEFAFKGDPSYTSILLDGSIEVVTLANNHSSDYGAQSLADTQENLKEAGIDYCIGNTISYQEVSGVKVAFIGIYELASGMDCESQVRETIAEAQAEEAQLIIVAFHWGTETETAADATQQALAHIAVDCGADLVVGHHPHVLQGIEKYNGKYIVYSLGNFCFGGNTNPSDKDTMIFRQTFTITSDGVAEDDAIEIIPCTISSTSSYNDYRPTPATGADADAIMERINEYSAEFGDITYVASDGL